MDLRDIIALTQAGFTKDDIMQLIIPPTDHVSNSEHSGEGNGTGTGTPTPAPTPTPTPAPAWKPQVTPYTQGFNPLPTNNFSGVTPGQVWNGTAPVPGQNVNNNVNNQSGSNDIVSALNSLRDAVQLNNINLSANNVPAKRTTEDIISEIINPPSK